jgi:hypothetical protein
MVIRLRALAAEVTRVTLEVGSQGKLGGSAMVEDVEGVWQELTHNVGYWLHDPSYAIVTHLLQRSIVCARTLPTKYGLLPQ